MGQICIILIYGHHQGSFVTVRAGTAYRHHFFQVKKKLIVMYIINETVISG